MSDQAVESRAKTAQGLRDEFMDACRAAADFWAEPGNSPDRDWPDRVRGALHSFLCIIDGVSGDMPALRLIADPHPDDKAYHQSEGENWTEAGTDITGSDYLHDRLYYGTWEQYRGPHSGESGG